MEADVIAPEVRVASDVGGTFTDNIAYDGASGRLTVAKVLTTPDNRAHGTVEGLKRALALQSRSGEDVAYVGHGMTTATNAVIQRTGGRIAFVTNAGFRDILLIGRQNRPSLYDIAKTRVAPLVSREDCYAVGGRIDADGREVAPLDESELGRIAAAIGASGARAAAICFLHAYGNPSHERRAKEILARALPGLVICASTDILAEYREYERASTAVLNAYLVPIMERYLGSLTELLSAPEGLALPKGRPIMVMEGSGGLMSLESAREKPVHTVLSGPAGGVVASAYVAALCGARDIITMDMGGTSTDISLVLRGKPEVTSQASLAGIPVRVPVIDINAIGAGGGSIAWIDEGGALRVGPMSAEAVPGPACYRRGGRQPTVTDANLVLGRLGPETRLGGDLTLDVEAARQAVAKCVADSLGLDVISAAAGVLKVAHANMSRGIRVVSVERGHDPRELTLVPFGGAGPMHGSPLARSLGIPRLLVPPTPGILCALGMLVSDLRHDLIETHLGRHEDFDAARLKGILSHMQARARNLLAADDIPPQRQRVEVSVEMRYVGQSYELAVPLPSPDGGSWARMPAAFHAEHRRRFGHADERAPIEVVNFRVVAVGLITAPHLPRPQSGCASPPDAARVGERRIFFEGAATEAGSWFACPVWRREALLAGNELAGPTVIEEISATTVLYPGDRARIDSVGSIIVEVGHE
ncbi:MAG: hydantoinase/oxoprolinase family protein [Alphaproteobacteria bacterium]